MVFEAETNIETKFNGPRTLIATREFYGASGEFVASGCCPKIWLRVSLAPTQTVWRGRQPPRNVILAENGRPKGTNRARPLIAENLKGVTTY